MLGKEIQLKAPGIPRCSFSKQPPICLKHTTFWALLPLIIALSLQSDISSSISTASHSFNCLHVPHYPTVSLFLPLVLETIRLWGLLASNLRFLLQPICLPPRTGPTISITGLPNSLREQGINQWSTGSSNPQNIFARKAQSSWPHRHFRLHRLHPPKNWTFSSWPSPHRSVSIPILTGSPHQGQKPQSSLLTFALISIKRTTCCFLLSDFSEVYTSRF